MKSEAPRPAGDPTESVTRNTERPSFPVQSVTLFLLVWFLFVAKALLYISITPMWEGFDELFHFAYVESLASTHSLPVWGETFIHSEIAESTAYLPLAGLMPRLVAGPDKLSYREYWALAEEERESMKDKLFGLKASSEARSISDVPLYQVQHPPLYYAFCAIIYKVTDNMSLVSKVFILRLFSVLLASTCVIAAALLVNETDLPFAPAFAGLVALLPGLYVDIGRVGNDSAGVALFAFLFLGMARFARNPSPGRAALVGMVLGAGLLTKAYFLTALPALALFSILLAYTQRDRKRKFVQNMVAALLIAIAVGGWWYVRNYQLYGTFSGLQETLHFPTVGLAERAKAAFEISWALVLKYLFVTFAWISGWSFIQLPKVAYIPFVILFLIALAGVARYAVEWRTSRLWSERMGGVPEAAMLLVGCFAIGIAYHRVNAYATVQHMGGPGGWYLYALVVPISFLLSLGIWNIHQKRARWVFVALFATIGAVEAYGLVFVLIPYYAGVAVSTNGWGVRFLEPFARVLSPEIPARVAFTKPVAITPFFISVVAGLCCVFELAVLGLIARWRTGQGTQKGS